MERRTVIVPTLNGDTASTHSSKVTLRRLPWDLEESTLAPRPETDPPRGGISGPYDGRGDDPREVGQ